MDQKKMLFIIVPAFVLFVGYIIYDEVLKNRGPDEKEENTENTIVFADDEFTGTDSQEIEPMSTESKVDLLKEKYAREKEEALLERKVIDHEDFFGNAEPTSRSEDTSVEREIIEVDDRESLEASFAKRQVQEKPNYVKKNNTEVKNTLPEKTEEVTRRSRDANDMFNSSETMIEVTEDNRTNVDLSTMVEAMVHGDHEINNGQNVLIRLTEAIKHDGMSIPRNTFLNAEARFNRDRVILIVKHISYNGKIVPVDTKIYDAYDSSEGIYVPGGVEREIKDGVVGDVVSEASRRLDVPLVGTVKVGTNKKLEDPIVNIGNGHKLFVKFN